MNTKYAKGTMLLSKSCVYGIRASLYMASLKEQEFVSIREISDKLNISFHFLTKILQQLTSANLMESFRGPNGGIRLTRSPEKIKLIEVVTAIDGMSLFTECALGLPGCGVQRPCPLHDKWAETRDQIYNMLANTTLTELSEKAKKEHLRLSDESSLNNLI